MRITLPAKPLARSGGGLVPLEPPARRPVVSAFQPDAIAIEERAPHRFARVTLYCVALLIVTAVTWAALAPIDEIAVAHGRLVTVVPNIVIQPFETAIVRSLDVQVGDAVTAGQTLAVLDPTVAQADVTQVRSRFDSADALTKRLEAEMAGTIYQPDDAADGAQALEASLFAQRATYLQTSLRNFDEQLARTDATLIRSRDERAALQVRLDGIREIEAMRQTLFTDQTGSKLNLLQARDTRLDIEGSVVRLDGGVAETQHDRERILAQRQAFVADFRRATLDAAAEARAKRDTAQEELKKNEMRRKLVVLTAPADGVVLEIAQRSVGSVLREAEPLMTLVQTGVPLEAEVMIDPKDLGHVAIGQDARVKFDAFPFQKHGTAHGTLRTISQDAFASSAKDTPQRSQDAALAFRARLTLASTDLRSVPAGFHFTPGMSVQAEIVVGKRTVLSYLVYPLTQALDEGLRER